MDNLRVVLIVIASLVIVALLIHGFWINKKERSTLFDADKKKKNMSSNDLLKSTSFHDDFDDVGEVKVVSSSKSDATHENNKRPLKDAVEDDSMLHQIQETPIQRDLFAEEPVIETETVAPNTSNIDEVTIKLDLDENETFKSIENTEDDLHSSHHEDVDKIESKPVETQKSEVLVLHVAGLSGELVRGDLLLSSIAQSGFQYGEMKIFHRHIDPAGNGPILFSLANMVKPGYLDPDTMHELRTPGVSIFMMIPSHGNNQQNFKLMLQTAQHIADDVNGMVLDDEHHMLTPQKITKYKDKIKAICQE